MKTDTAKPKEQELSINMELRLLSKAQEAFEAMPTSARKRALQWFKSKYIGEWPSDVSY